MASALSAQFQVSIWSLAVVGSCASSITPKQVDDTVSVYTGFVNGSNVCGVTSAGMTCNPMINIDELDWVFYGALVGGSSGYVSYVVMVDNRLSFTEFIICSSVQD